MAQQKAHRGTYNPLWALGIVALVTVVAGFARSAVRPPAGPAPQAPAVTVAQVIHRPLKEWHEFTGRLEAVNTVEVRPRVNGFVNRVTFTEGARVKKGQLLFQIDPRPFRAEVVHLAAERDRAESDLELAKANRARAERLIGANAISREEYERLVATETSAEAAVGSVTGSLDAAQLNLEFTEVRAPIDGHVSRALITQGNLVTGASVLTTVVSDDPVYAYFDADEQTFLHYTRNRAVNGANAVHLALADEQGYPHEGRLDFVNNQVDAASGTIRARAIFANPDGRFTPGLFARIRLLGREDEDAVLIEGRAVGTDLGKRFVLVLAPQNRVEYREVELGAEIDGLRLVARGLSPADTIVVNGLQHVRPGMTVTPTRVAMNDQQEGLRQVTGSGSGPRLAARLP
jgi:membrane fusion protein, multidrug efflux system